MKSLAVLLDGSHGSWQAVYTALHVAVRTHSRLLALASTSGGGEIGARQLLREFETGARAAGIPYDLRLIRWPQPEDLEGLCRDLDAVFLFRPFGTRADELMAYYRQLSVPVWIFGTQRSIRRIAVIADNHPSSAVAVAQGRRLAKRMEAGLRGLYLGERLPESAAGTETQSIAWELVIRPQMLLDRLAAGEFDLAVFARPVSRIPEQDLCLGAPSLIASYPALSSG
jgi:hypothetical protein